jgi:hypothetical protein
MRVKDALREQCMPAIVAAWVAILQVSWRGGPEVAINRPISERDRRHLLINYATCASPPVRVPQVLGVLGKPRGVMADGSVLVQCWLARPDDGYTYPEPSDDSHSHATYQAAGPCR